MRPARRQIIAFRFRGRGLPGQAPRKAGKFRINEDIRVRQLRLVDQNGEMVGIVPTEQALEMAREAELDLVEVSPNADPPVCKILDYGKFKYEQKKKEHDARKKQRGGDFKEIRLRPKTDPHDRDIKLSRARRFLMEGDRVQVTLIFRGREMQHISQGGEILHQVAKDLEDVAKIERHADRDGRRMHISLMPKPGLKPPPKGTRETKETKEAKETKGRDKDREGPQPVGGGAAPGDAAPEAADPSS